MPHIIVKNYEHFNTALPNWNTPKGVYIKTKDQYDRAVKSAGMVSYDEMMAKTEANSRQDKKYKPSDKALAIMRHAIDKADKKGNVRLDGRAIKALGELKALRPKVPSYMKLPKQYEGIGGFDNGK